MICYYYITYEENYEHINHTIFDGNVMNMYLIIMEGKYGAIDYDDSSCHSYYIIKKKHPHIPFKQTLVFMGELFLMVK